MGSPKNKYFLDTYRNLHKLGDLSLFLLPFRTDVHFQNLVHGSVTMTREWVRPGTAKDGVQVISSWNKTTKVKSSTSAHVTHEIQNALGTNELQFSERRKWPYFMSGSLSGQCTARYIKAPTQDCVMVKNTGPGSRWPGWNPSSPLTRRKSLF